MLSDHGWVVSGIRSKPRQFPRQLAVAALGGVLVDHRGVRCGVAQACLELGGGGSGLGGEGGARVAKVVEAKVGASGRSFCRVDRL